MDPGVALSEPAVQFATFQKNARLWEFETEEFASYGP